MFWSHFRHLRICGVLFGAPVRALVPTRCLGCRRLWESCEPLGHGLYSRPSMRGHELFVRVDHDEASERTHSASEPLSVTRVRHFTIAHR